jgi:hypothetical protein
MGKRPDLTERNTTHGLSTKDKRLYQCWKHMRSRCNNPNNKDYHNYGGRGIAVCDEWNDYAAFYTWSIANGYRDNLTLDRINSNGNYGPDNCRWADVITQGINKRTTHKVELNGKTLTLKEIAEMYGLQYETVKYRYRVGWSIEKIITTKDGRKAG